MDTAYISDRRTVLVMKLLGGGGGGTGTGLRQQVVKMLSRVKWIWI
jgi:hypothetical protein